MSSGRYSANGSASTTGHPVPGSSRPGAKPCPTGNASDTSALSRFPAAPVIGQAGESSPPRFAPLPVDVARKMERYDGTLGPPRDGRTRMSASDAGQAGESSPPRFAPLPVDVARKMERYDGTLGPPRDGRTRMTASITDEAVGG